MNLLVKWQEVHRAKLCSSHTEYNPGSYIPLVALARYYCPVKFQLCTLYLLTKSMCRSTGLPVQHCKFLSPDLLLTMSWRSCFLTVATSASIKSPHDNMFPFQVVSRITAELLKSFPIIDNISITIAMKLSIAMLSVLALHFTMTAEQPVHTTR